VLDCYQCCCRYFPYVNGAESLPQSRNQFIEQAQKDAFATQPMATQQRNAAQENREGPIFLTSDDEGDETEGNEPHPIFEVFWQVRSPLIGQYPSKVAHMQTSPVLLSSV
jgi:hypothetical protein